MKEFHSFTPKFNMMLPRIPIFILLLSAAVMQACNSNHQNMPAAPQESQVSFDSFTLAFDSISLPYSLPKSEQNTSNKEMDKGLVTEFFEGLRFDPAFGEERDVPDLAENADAAKYFYDVKFHGGAYTALVIRKQDDADSYYYLSTFTPDGKFIDGMCIAFSEGDQGDKTERRTAINDDYSIQLMQINTIGGQATEEAETRFYEIAADGHINRLDNKNTGQTPL